MDQSIRKRPVPLDRGEAEVAGNYPEHKPHRDPRDRSTTNTPPQATDAHHEAR